MSPEITRKIVIEAPIRKPLKKFNRRFFIEWFTQKLKGIWRETHSKAKSCAKTNLSNIIDLNILIFNVE